MRSALLILVFVLSISPAASSAGGHASPAVAAAGLRSATAALGGTMTPESLPEFDALWDYNQPDSTERRFRELLPAARASGNDAYHAELLSQIARTQGLQRRFDAAHETLDEAQALLRADLHRARVRVLLERGRVFNSSGNKEEARPSFLAAWELAREAGEENLAVDAAHMLGIIEPPEEAIAWNRRAMDAAEGASDPKARRWLGPLYNNLGWTYHDRGDPETALELFRKAEAWRESQGQARETRVARWCVARALRSLHRVEEALAMQEALRADWEAAGEPDGYVFEELGECLLALGRAEEARPHCLRAWELLSADPWLQANEPARLERLRGLGNGEAP